MKKPKGYYSFLRRDVLPYIPDDAKNILSLGCASAVTEGAYKRSHNCKITGIEINPEAAKLAEEQIDEVIIDNVQEVPGKIRAQRFDCILAMDILEHLKNPWHALKKYTELLTDNGVVIASIPNVNFLSVRAGLQYDLFPYTPAGILDITHMRFFTMTEIYKLFAYADLKIIRTNPFENRTTSYQYIVTGKKLPPTPKKPLATVIIPTCNNLSYLKEAITSLRRWTRVPYKIIVIDNGSTDGTGKWLEEQGDIMQIKNVVNLGFGPAINQGLTCVTTPWFVIANDDLIFTPDWLAHLLAHTLNDDKIGMVGPMTNYVSGPQHTIAYQGLLPKFTNEAAKQRYEKYKGHSTTFPRIVFFCTLIRLSLIGNVGILDERFGLGNYEDDDYCLRATRAGYELIIAKDVFIFHYGSKTYGKDPDKFKKLLAKNKQLFKEKWGIDKK